MVGAAGTAKVLAETCGEVSTTRADAASAIELATADRRTRRDLPWADAAGLCVITDGYSHWVGRDGASDSCLLGQYLGPYLQPVRTLR